MVREQEPTYLRNQTLEERGESFVLYHASYDFEATFWMLEITVLDSGLDHIKGC